MKVICGHNLAEPLYHTVLPFYQEKGSRPGAMKSPGSGGEEAGADGRRQALISSECL